jgi:hypothetical protein
MGLSELDRSVRDARANAIVAWLLVSFVLLVAIGNLLADELLWAGFATVVAVIALIPAGALRTPRAMLPWEVLLLAIVPLLGRTVVTVPILGWRFTALPQTGALAQYFSVAALALLVTVELHTFTNAKMNPQFAVGFVVIATMATAGVWAVARWVPDVLLGTEFLLAADRSEEAIEHDLMLEFVYSTLAGLLAGVVFQAYFRQRARTRERVVG